MAEPRSRRARRRAPLPRPGDRRRGSRLRPPSVGADARRDTLPRGQARAPRRGDAPGAERGAVPHGGRAPAACAVRRRIGARRSRDPSRGGVPRPPAPDRGAADGHTQPRPGRGHDRGRARRHSELRTGGGPLHRARRRRRRERPRISRAARASGARRRRRHAQHIRRRARVGARAGRVAAADRGPQRVPLRRGVTRARGHLARGGAGGEGSAAGGGDGRPGRRPRLPALHPALLRSADRRSAGRSPPPPPGAARESRASPTTS